MAPTVYLVVHNDKDAATTVLGVFAALEDANADCLAQAAKTGFPHAPTTGSDIPAADGLLRWDTPDGVTCWVESHSLRLAKEAAARAGEDERAGA